MAVKLVDSGATGREVCAPAYFLPCGRARRLGLPTHAHGRCCCPSLLRSGCWLHAHPSVCRTDAGRRRCQAVDHHGAAATSSSSSRPSARSSSASPRPQPPPGDRPRPSSATSAARHAAAAVAAEVEEARRDRDEAEAKVREVLSRQSASRLEEAEEDVRREVELKESSRAHRRTPASWRLGGGARRGAEGRGGSCSGSKGRRHATSRSLAAGRGAATGGGSGEGGSEESGNGSR